MKRFHIHVKLKNDTIIQIPDGIVFARNEDAARDAVIDHFTFPEYEAKFPYGFRLVEAVDDHTHVHVF